MDFREATHINLPKQIVERAKTNRHLQDLVAFSLAIKMYSKASQYKPTVRKVMSDFHVGTAKAKRLIKDAKENKELFRYNPKTNTLTARTYKKNIRVNKDKTGRTIYHSYCIKFKIIKKEEIRLSEILRDLGNVLILNAINAHSRQTDKFKRDGLEPCRSNSAALSQRKLASISGASRSTVSRRLNRLEQNNEISVKKGCLRLVLYCVNDYTINEENLQNRHIVCAKNSSFGYVCERGEYSIVMTETKKRFCNIIFNHEKRHTNYSKVGNDFYSREINSMYD